MKNEIILVLISVFNLVYSNKFSFKVPSSSMKCLGEYLTENTVGKKLIIYINKIIF
jgi:hypothetical protein